MSKINANQKERNPYRKKLQKWEEEIAEIEIFVSNLPNLTWFNVVPIALYKRCTSSDKDELYQKIEKLENIKSGLRKMTETLSLTMADDPSNPDLSEYLAQIVDIRLKTSQLIREISQKDPQKFLQSMVNDESE
jgi:hypothetical protein